MDENDPIWRAIDMGGGMTCDVEGILRELTKAGYEIRKMPVEGETESNRVRAFVRDIAVQNPHPDQPESRTVIAILAQAWGAAVRVEWHDFVAADPELTAQIAVARELMRADGYTMEAEPLCGLPGIKPAVATVDGKECYCADHSMVQVTPLSAIYVNKVREVMDAAARVSQALAEEAAKDPNQEWPIKTAAGEVFNSIEEMEASPNEFVRGLAKQMRDGAAARVATPQSWQDQEKRQ